MKTNCQTLINEARARMGEKYINENRFNKLIHSLVGHKWSDFSFLEDFRPEGEKYITRESLLKALDEHK